MNLKDLFNHPIINLDKQIRYSNLKVMFPENVAEHSELVANIAIIIAINLVEEFPLIKLDIKELAYRGVIHDWGESVTCDITSDVKYSLPELPEILENIESVGLNKLFKNKNIIEEINNSRSGSIEGDLILIADRLQSLFKMTKEYMIQRTESWKYSILNNSTPHIINHINEFWNKYYKDSYGDSPYGLLQEFISGIQELELILNSKIDFI